MSQQVKDLANPQEVYSAKARDVRAEHIDGRCTCTATRDILALNKHPDVLGNGGRGGSFGHDARLIPLEIDGPDHRKWRRLLDPMFAPRQMMRLESQIRDLSRELIGTVREAGGGDLHDALAVPLPCQTFLGLIGAPVEDLDFFLEFRRASLHPKGATTERSTRTWLSPVPSYRVLRRIPQDKRKTADKRRGRHRRVDAGGVRR